MSENDQSVKTAQLGELWTHWPRGGRQDLLEQLKGSVADALKDKHDDSATRLSVAFNRSGHPMPKSSIYSGIDVKDSHGFRLMTSCDDMKHFLTQKLGKPRHMKNQEAAAGRKGIVLFEHVKSIPDSIGHVELWDGQVTADPTGDYWTEAKDIHLWELKE